MAEEKEIQSELQEEQLNEVAGGNYDPLNLCDLIASSDSFRERAEKAKQILGEENVFL